MLRTSVVTGLLLATVCSASAADAPFALSHAWIVVTLDDGKQGVTRDLRPRLPMVVRY